MSEHRDNNSRLDQIEQKLNNIETKLDLLLEKMEISVKECSKMGEHIDFIENVYDTVKKPLDFICDKVNMFSSNEQKHLENIEPKNRIMNTNLNSSSDESDNEENDYHEANDTIKITNEYQELIDGI